MLELVDVCRPEKRLLAGAGAGVLVFPNMFVAGAGVAGSAGFGVAAPKLNGLAEDVARAAAGVFSVFCASASAPAPKPPKAGVAAGVALFCPKLKRLVEAGAGVLVLAGAAELVAPN